MSTTGPGQNHRAIDPLTPHRTPGPQRRAWRWLVGVVAALTVFGAGTAVGVYWASRTGTPQAEGSPTPAASATVTAAPTTAASASVTAPASASSSVSSAGAVRAIPVYYLADVAGGPRLYREFHALPLLNGSPALTAVTEMLRGTPVDPDYSSPWPKTVTVRSLTVSGDLATVDLSGFVTVGAAYEAASVQQLVYTVPAADHSVTRVKLLVNGAVPASGHIDWSNPVTRADALDAQAFVWILAPQQGDTVSSPFTVSVYGTGWEGNVPLEVYQGDRVVASTHVTTMMGGFVEAHTTIQLSPGTYELRAYTDNGRDSTLQLWDTKTFAVR